MAKAKNENKEMNDQLKVRREKLQELIDEGIDPFGHRFERTDLAQTLDEKYGDRTKEDLEATPISMIGQVRSRSMYVKMSLVKKTIISSNVQI